MQKSSPMWMVRAGEAGYRLDAFKADSLVSLGWHEAGSFAACQTRADFARAMAHAYPGASTKWLAASAGQCYRFVREMTSGDAVLTYDRSQRSYLVGEVTGGYVYQPGSSQEHPNIRPVRWVGAVPRDALSVAARNSLGSISTLFLVPQPVAREIRALLGDTSVERMNASPSSVDNELADVVQEVDDLYRDVQSKGFEFIKDRVSALDWEEMQELVAGLLRAMGYKTRLSPSGSDRGKDIIASPDGLGFEDPRIVVEVKHRAAAMGSQEIRSFLGGRHDHDKGLYVSTGGFTKEARYEAERGRIPVTLMDLDDLVRSLLEHYENMDAEMQRLVPLRKVYWPA